MTSDNKPPMFGPSDVFDPASHVPRSGKAFWMAATDVSSLTDKEGAAETIIGNCTTSLPFKFEFDPKDSGHTLMFGSTRNGMSALSEELQDQYVRAGGTLHVVDKGKTSGR
ncbi:MAG TPA: hypothetical protein VNJ04_17240 [Gemmatimonadaceae bacterium]|nr:hypothetical protein [Gemmatimonadaceae bacterium]